MLDINNSYLSEEILIYQSGIINTWHLPLGLGQISLSFKPILAQPTFSQICAYLLNERLYVNIICAQIESHFERRYTFRKYATCRFVIQLNCCDRRWNKVMKGNAIFMPLNKCSYFNIIAYWKPCH